MNLQFLFGLFVSIEVILILIVKLLRKDFQWLITSEDEYPKFDPKGLKSFFSKSFDPKLGWVRKKNSTGIEKGERGQIYFQIDEIGSQVSANSRTLMQ